MLCCVVLCCIVFYCISAILQCFPRISGISQCSQGFSVSWRVSQKVVSRRRGCIALSSLRESEIFHILRTACQYLSSSNIYINVCFCYTPPICSLIHPPNHASNQERINQSSMIASLSKGWRRFPRVKKITLLLILLCSFGLFHVYNVSHTPSSISTATATANAYSFIPAAFRGRKRPVVKDKKSLLDVDILPLLQKQDLKRVGFNEHIRSGNFTKKTATGYVSNLDVSHLAAFNNHNHNVNANKDDLTTGKSKSVYHDYANAVECSDLAYNNTLEYLVGEEYLDVDYISMRRQLLAMDNDLAKEYSLKEEEHMSETEIIEKRWYAFGTVAVWLETENCYVAYTRMIYSRFENRGRSYISSIVGQTYDADWNEIKGKRIFYRDVSIPDQVKRTIDNLEREKLYKTNCEKSSNNPTLSEECQAKTNKRLLKIQKKIDTLLDKYSVQYPTVMNVPFKMREKWNGPEDPHIILKKDSQGEEPVIIFNMLTHKNRMVHAMMPHRKIDPIVAFNIEDLKMRGLEKNWSPFLYPGRIDSSNASPGFIYFVYDYNPLEILSCSLVTGTCTLIFDAGTLDIEKGKSGAIRGGTQYIPLPDVLPEVQNKKMWIGFPKSHVEYCGCGSRVYRPVLSLLIESEGVYHLELIAPNIDFGMDVLGWNLKDTYCGGYNVLAPSGISNWVVVDQDPKTKLFEDYMTLTFSEADAVSGQVTIRGVLNYILQIYKDKDIKEEFVINTEAASIAQKTSNCASQSCKDECKRYGLTHVDPKKVEEERKKQEEKKLKEEEKKRKEEEKKKQDELKKQPQPQKKEDEKKKQPQQQQQQKQPQQQKQDQQKKQPQQQQKQPEKKTS